MGVKSAAIRLFTKKIYNNYDKIPNHFLPLLNIQNKK